MGTSVIVLSGDYDLSKQASLRADLDVLRNASHLVVDMTAVPYIDSTCVGELLRLQRHRVVQGYEQLAIVRKAPIVNWIFTIVRMGTLCRLADTLDEVLPKNGEAVAVHYARPGRLAEATPIRDSRMLIAAGR